MKITIETYGMWDALTDKQRTALILNLVCTAPNPQEFLPKLILLLNKLDPD